MGWGFLIRDFMKPAIPGTTDRVDMIGLGVILLFFVIGLFWILAKKVK